MSETVLTMREGGREGGGREGRGREEGGGREGGRREGGTDGQTDTFTGHRDSISVGNMSETVC